MKRALVISGGGSKGAFAVGILQQFKRLFPSLHFDIIVGTSTGALISPLAATEEIDLLTQIYTSVTTDKIITQHRIGDRLSEKSIYTVEPLYQLLKTIVTDTRYNTIKNSGKQVYIITTCLQNEEVTVYTTNPSPKTSAQYLLKTIKDAEHLRLAVLASACQPVLMTPVKVDFNYSNGGDKSFQYVDGGVREYAGVQLAIDQGATEVFCILLSDGKGSMVTSEYATLFPILERTLSIFTTDVQKNDVYIPEQYTKAVAYLQAVKAKMKNDGVPQSTIDNYFAIEGSINPLEVPGPVKVFIIKPNSPLGGGPGGLLFNPTEMQAMVDTGRNAADVFIARLKPGDQTWLA